MEPLFVYGSLKTGQANHCLLAGRPLQPAWAQGLVLHPGPGYPFAVLGQGAVQGELYRVEPALLAELDVFEGSQYQRRLHPVTLANGIACPAWVYLASARPATPAIPTGVWP